LNKRPTNYHTKQGEAVLDFLESQGGAYVTAAQVVAHFQHGNALISRTTVYRQLERLVQEGKARKHTFDGILGTCYQYVQLLPQEQEAYHLKCEECGVIYDLKCHEVHLVSQHIFQSHAFRVDDSKTVFYGTCQNCLQK